MSKRKLSKQQQSRIAAKQERQLASESAADSAFTSHNKCNGRVISHYGQQLDVESLLPEDEGKSVRCFQRANLPELVTGDYVVWEYENDETGVIVASSERRNVFSRPGFAGKIKPVAANLDIVLVVIATLPEAFGNLIDRYLVAITTLGLDAAIVLNKADLLSESNRESLENLLSTYRDLDYPVFKISAKTGDGIKELETLLAQKTTVLVGQSGVGKSSIVNRLSDTDDTNLQNPDFPKELSGKDFSHATELTETGELSAGKYKGTHTTTTARLFHLVRCDLIDSPGIREFELGHVSSQDVERGFPEIAAQSLHCKFRDCSHNSEPGCAVLAAVAEGKISNARMDSFRQILNSL